MDRISSAGGINRRAIIRSRTGCLTCRRRRLKCDEGKPDCHSCVRRSLHCDYGARFVFRDDTAFVARRATEVEQAKWAAIREQDHQRHPPKRRKNSSAAEPLSPLPPGAASSPCISSRSQSSSVPRRGDVISVCLTPSQEHEATRRQQAARTPVDTGETAGDGAGENESGRNYGDENYLTVGVVSDKVATSHAGDRSESEAIDGFVNISTPQSASRPGGASGHAPGTDASFSDHDAQNGEATTDAGSYNSPSHLCAGQSGTPGTSPSSYNESSIWTAGDGGNRSLTTTTDSPMLNMSYPSDMSWLSYYCSTLPTGPEPKPWVTDLATARTSHMWAEPSTSRASDWDPAEGYTQTDPAREAEHLSYWRRKLLPRLPSVFADIEPLIAQNEVVKLAVLALSASRLTEWGPRPGHVNTSRPRPPDQHPSPPSSSSSSSAAAAPDNSESFAYYSQALRTFATSRLCGFAAMETCAKLVALLLFSHMELTLGTMHGSYSHVLKCDEVVRAEYDSVVRSALGCRLVVEWAGLRARLAADTPPFHPKFARAFSGSLIQADVDRLVDVSSADLPFLMLRLSNTYYASDLLLFLQVVGSDATSATYRTWRGLFSRIGRQGPGDHLTDESPSKLLAMLDADRALLNAWHERLPLTSRPVEGFCSDDFEEFNSRVSGLRVRPLRFTTHRAAMTYLLYACAQLYASRGNLERCRSGGGGGGDNEDPWVLLVLRILAGLDARACLAENTFEYGATWVITRVALRCCSMAVLAWLGGWLLRLEAEAGTGTGAAVAQEGSLPIRLVRQAVAMIAAEQEGDRVVNSFFTSFDQFQEKQVLCRMSFDGSRPRAVVLGTARLRGDGSRGSGEVVPFVDVI